MQNYPNNQKYRIIENLDQGGFGSAYKVLNKDNSNIYVIKKIPINNAEEKERNKILNEANILSSIDSEYIVKYYESFSDENSFNIVMEYCDGLDLRKFINEHKKRNKLLKKELILQIISDICLGIKEIHDKKIIHRDLKPDNLLIGGDLKIKIGDFGISKQLNNYNEYAKTQVGTLRYMAPEIIRGEKYNNKVDVWSLGCIIHELCSLNFCFWNESIEELIKKIQEAKYLKINEKIYGNDLQNLINDLLKKNSCDRPNIDKIIEDIQKFIKKLDNEKKIELFINNEVYEDYIIEKEIKNSLDIINMKVFERQTKYEAPICIFIFLPILLVTSPILFTLGISGLFSNYMRNFGESFLNKIFNFFEILFRIDFNKSFIMDNYIIIHFIKAKILKVIMDKLDERLLPEKIIIYNQKEFEINIEKIKKKFISLNHIKDLRKIFSDNFNILLLGQTNVGKSTLINEFLKLEEELKAEEGKGRETPTIDFTPYVGIRNNQQYTLYDTNGITLQGRDSIIEKRLNTSNEIKERIKRKNPNELIHCIWYCITNSNVQEADKGFIEELLNIYTIHKIPIIFVHTKSFCHSDFKKCKNGLKNILEIICKGDKSKVKKYLKNYIKVIAREDNEESEESEDNEKNKEEETVRAKACGLEELEKISRKEIIEEGQKSSYYEYIKQNVLDILINTSFNLVFHSNNIKKLTEVITQDINKYLNTILKILDSDNLNLSDDIKNKNKISLKNMNDSFKNVKEAIEVEFKNFLSMDYLKKDNGKFIKEIYESKSDNYKNKMNFNDFKKNVEKLIYGNIVGSKEIINNLINLSFNNYIIQVMKNGLKEQFQQKEEEYIKQIYSELFRDN